MTRGGPTGLARGRLYVRAMSTAELTLSPASLAPSDRQRRHGALAVAAWMLSAALPLVGLVSLLLREQLDPDWSNHRVHFIVFLGVGVGIFVLAYAAGGAADPPRAAPRQLD